MRWVLGCCLAVGLWGVACGESGQTGAAACAHPHSCACAFLENRLLVRARVLEVNDETRQSTLEVDELLHVPPDLEGAQAGFRIVGPSAWWDPTRARETYCTMGNSDQPSVGSSVLVSLHRWDATDCEDCRGDCYPACASATASWFFLFMPWQNSYDLAGTELAIEELVPLSEGSECQTLFPYPPLQECDDIDP